MNNDKVFQMDFGKTYRLLLDKATRKGRTKAEVDEVICWLTGYSPEQLEASRTMASAYGTFSVTRPSPIRTGALIKGVVCGVRWRSGGPPHAGIRYLDKLIDELARKAVERCVIVFPIQITIKMDILFPQNKSSCTKHTIPALIKFQRNNILDT